MSHVNFYSTGEDKNESKRKWVKNIHYGEYNLYVSRCFRKYLIHFLVLNFVCVGGGFSTAIGVTCLVSNKFSSVQIPSSSNSMHSESLKMVW